MGNENTCNPGIISYQRQFVHHDTDDGPERTYAPFKKIASGVLNCVRRAGPQTDAHAQSMSASHLVACSTTICAV